MQDSHTFFIPVDAGFRNTTGRLVDDKVIDGHVIPRMVLFTTPTKKGVPFRTLADDYNGTRVVISFSQEHRGYSTINYVKSHTLLSDGKHTPGVVFTEIVKANIPVKNGVVHLIQKPLIIVDYTIKDLLQDKDKHLNTYNFYNEIFRMGPEGKEFLWMIDRHRDITLFVPCDKALNSSIWHSIIRDKQRFMEILQLHVVNGSRLDVQTVMMKHQQGIDRARTFAEGKNLHFKVAVIGSNTRMTVEGGGINATIIHSDLAATNGILHIIDRVLGVPYETVWDKLSTDLTLRHTFNLGRTGGFNDQLNDTTKKFTYFVRSNRAWQDARVRMPSAIKKWFMRDYAYFASATLQRHLIVSQEAYTMKRITQLSTNDDSILGVGINSNRTPPGVKLPTVRGSLNLHIMGERPDRLKVDVSEASANNTFLIHWNGLVISVIRPDIECTNGIIHVIDLPFLKEGDIWTSGSVILKSSAIVSLIARAIFFNLIL